MIKTKKRQQFGDVLKTETKEKRSALREGNLSEEIPLMQAAARRMQIPKCRTRDIEWNSVWAEASNRVLNCAANYLRRAPLLPFTPFRELSSPPMGNQDGFTFFTPLFISRKTWCVSSIKWKPSKSLKIHKVTRFSYLKKQQQYGNENPCCGVGWIFILVAVNDMLPANPARFNN